MIEGNDPPVDHVFLAELANNRSEKLDLQVQTFFIEDIHNFDEFEFEVNDQDLLLHEDRHEDLLFDLLLSQS